MLPNPDKPHMGAGGAAAGNFFYFMGGGLFRHLSKHFY